MIWSLKTKIVTFQLIFHFIRIEQSNQFTSHTTCALWSKTAGLKEKSFSKRYKTWLQSSSSVAYPKDGFTDTTLTTKTCYYKTPEGKWAQRINLVDLKVGQQLRGVVVQELLEGKTGPKVFFECGVGRINKEGDWKIVNGMLRLGSRGGKKSVIAKRVAKLKKQPIDLFVSRVDLDRARLELCNSQQEALEGNKNMVKKISASTLKPGQELIGRVVMLRPYGAMVDVGANRKGLLHITKVADLYERYIDKEKGLEEAGLNVGTKIRVSVASNYNKRLFLDFTNDVKKEAGVFIDNSDSSKQQIKVELQNTDLSPAIKQQTEALPVVNKQFDLSAEQEEAAWAAFATDESSTQEEGNDEDEYDEYDEDRDIEDALGLGTY